MAVRLDKELRATIDKIVASYNRKITYYSRKGIKGLPEKTSFSKIISLGSRKSIKNELKSLASLNAKNIDRVIAGGELTTVYERDKIAKMLTRDKRILKNKIKNLVNTEYKNFGRGLGYTVGDKLSMSNLMMDLSKGNIRSDKLISALRKYERLSEVNVNTYFKMNKDEKESILNLLNRIENPYINPKLKQNYLEALTDLGYSYGYDNKKLAELEKKLKSLSNEEFDKLFSEDIGFQKLLNYYDIMKINLGINITDNQEAVFDLYDNLYDNIDFIIGTYRQ